MLPAPHIAGTDTNEVRRTGQGKRRQGWQKMLGGGKKGSTTVCRH